VNSLNGGGATSLAIIEVIYRDVNGVNQQFFPVQVPAGTVVGKSTATVSIPMGAHNFTVNISVQTRVVDTSGTLTLRVFEIWVMA
jgi:hypothetical protein